jgi:hypothetical protein
MRTYGMRLAVVLFLLSSLALTGCGSGGSTTGGSSGGSAASWSAALSADQQRVAEEFGAPSLFGVTFGRDILGQVKDPSGKAYRLEWWDYPELLTRFVFEDGAFVRSEAIDDAADVSTDEIQYAAVTPADFKAGMTPDEAAAAVGAKATHSFSFRPELMKGLTGYSWDGVVTAVFDEKGLVGVQTLPALKGGAK